MDVMEIIRLAEYWRYILFKIDMMEGYYTIDEFVRDLFFPSRGESIENNISIHANIMRESVEDTSPIIVEYYDEESGRIRLKEIDWTSLLMELKITSHPNHLMLIVKPFKDSEMMEDIRFYLSPLFHLILSPLTSEGEVKELISLHFDEYFRKIDLLLRLQEIDSKVREVVRLGDVKKEENMLNKLWLEYRREDYESVLFTLYEMRKNWGKILPFLQRIDMLTFPIHKIEEHMKRVEETAEKMLLIIRAMKIIK